MKCAKCGYEIIDKMMPVWVMQTLASGKVYDLEEQIISVCKCRKEPKKRLAKKVVKK